MIKFHSFKRVLIFGFVNFWRHWWLSITSVIFMAITLIIISLFVILNFGIQASTNAMKNKMDMNITFKPGVTEEQINELQHELSARTDIRSVEYISKQDALAKWQSLKIKESVKNLVNEDNNFLPESLAVKSVEPEALDSINEFVLGVTYGKLIESTSYQKNKDTVETFINATKVVKKVGTVVSAIFFVIAILIVLNTIRMAIYTRKDEIEIMRLVGASNHFITIPFIIESILYGIMGCILSLSFVSFGAIWLARLFNTYLSMDLNIDGAVLDHLVTITFLQLALGIFIGISSALISINRYLKT